VQKARDSTSRDVTGRRQSQLETDQSKRRKENDENPTLGVLDSEHLQEHAHIRLSAIDQGGQGDGKMS
jgi:hypothetical protein